MILLRLNTYIYTLHVKIWAKWNEYAEELSWPCISRSKQIQLLITIFIVYQNSLCFDLFHLLKAKNTLFLYPLIALKIDPNCHVSYLTALTRYFSVHHRIDFNNLIALYIIFVVPVELVAFGVLYSSLCNSSFIPYFPDQYTLRVLCCLLCVYSNHVEIFWKEVLQMASLCF